MGETAFLTAGELLAAYRARSLSPLEVVDALGARIEEHGPALGAFTTVCLERARTEAAAAERAYVRGEAAGALAGVPIAVKDLFDTAQVRTTYGSPMFAGNVPQADAVAVARARQAGAIVIGKTQMHEFAWGITSVNRLMGTSRNPWSLEHVAGGSSGGSAVALAASLAPLALGSDTGGSIRIPSAFCGTVGLKPTFGRVDTAGMFPLAPSLDHAGPMARVPADAMLLLDAIADPDAAIPGPLRRDADGLSGSRVGLCPDLHLVPLAPDVRRAYVAAAAALERAGATLIEVALPQARDAYATYGVIVRAEGLQAHVDAGLFPGREREYGEDVRARLELARTVGLPDYLAAARARERLRAGFARAFAQVDLLLTPVSAGSPAPIGAERVVHLGEEIDFRELVMSYTVPQDLAGLPACAIRAGFDGLGIPVGVQLTGPPWSERRVVAAAQSLYDATAEVQAGRPADPVTREP
jgi:aspartyl-tRNA(Asn)/glutamyl-tRNA(Gln) amidotransferase subunit A